MKNLLRAAFPENSVLFAETLRRVRTRSKLYAIFLTPRSGSTWLAELALNSGALGCPQEWFNEAWIYSDETALGCLPPRRRGTLDVNAYVEAIVAEGRGAAGVELSVFQAQMLAEMLEEPFAPDLLDASFYLTRRDKIAQAVSLYRSVASGYFHSYQSDPLKVSKFEGAEYNFQEILKWLRNIEGYESRFEAMFLRCKLNPQRIFYEDICLDPLAALNGICAAVGVQQVEKQPETCLRVLRDGISADWRRRFTQELGSL